MRRREVRGDLEVMEEARGRRVWVIGRAKRLLRRRARRDAVVMSADFLEQKICRSQEDSQEDSIAAAGGRGLQAEL